MRSFVKCCSRIYSPGRVLGGISVPICIEELVTVRGAPAADGIKIFQAKSNWISLAVAVVALGILLVCLQSFPRSEQLACKTRDFRDVCRGRRRWIVEKFSHHPRAALNRV